MTFLWEELSAAGEVSNVIEDSSMDDVSMVLKSVTRNGLYEQGHHTDRVCGLVCRVP